MWKRLVLALVKGGLGGFVGASVATAFGGTVPSPAVAYAAAAFSGVLGGLLAGKPAWAEGGPKEAAVKAPAGAFLAVATLFGFRKWLSSITVGAVSLGDAPFVALPLLSVAIALVLEIDDEFGADALVTGPPPEAARANPTADAANSVTGVASDSHPDGS